MRHIRLFGVVGAALKLLGPAKHAEAAGPGCTALAGQSLTVIGAAVEFFPNTEFEAGDVLSFRIDVLSTTNDPAATVFAFANLPPEFNSANRDTSVGPKFIDLQVSTTGSFSIGGGYAGGGGAGDDAIVTFLGCGLGGATEAATLQLARQSLAQRRAIVSRRTARLFSGGPGSADEAGAAGQASSPFGLWSDFMWSGVDDDNAVTAARSNAFTLAGGYDRPIGDDTLVGVVFGVGRAATKSDVAEIEAREFSVSVTPYAAYRLSDVVTAQAAASYARAFGEIDVVDANADYSADQWFLSAELSAFESWGDASLLASASASWAQSVRHSYTDSTGQAVGASTVRIASVSALVQPAYIFALDDRRGHYIEPYLVGVYSYDLLLTKIADAANDRDAVQLGAGVNLYWGDAISGGVEASTMLGAEDRRGASARGTLRIDF